MPAFSAFSISNFGFGARTTRGYFKPALPPPPSTIEYVMLGGGAGGGGQPGIGGGGGAGGYLAGTGLPVTYDVLFNVTVGAGGAAGQSTPNLPDRAGKNGGNSILEYGNPASPAKSSLTAYGGGGGGSARGGDNPDPAPYSTGRSGASGGGGAQRDGGGGSAIYGPQGNGGASGCNGPLGGNGGGGGGAGAGGGKGLGPSDGPTSGYPNPQYPAGAQGFGNGGVGGVGVKITFDGSTRYIGGGGGGGRDLGVPSFGGRNPAPNPGYVYPSGEPHGGAESGGDGGGARGGGGGGWNPVDSKAGKGGGGFVWIRYPSTNMPLAETSGLNSYTDNGTYKIYKWEGAGSFKWYAPGVDPNP